MNNLRISSEKRFSKIPVCGIAYSIGPLSSNI